ncbi:MAG: hypothetical protein CM1200mP30_17370 [Pseudomonadota bacterium]|nr:MAG: hypothetical protein CM1200mP30_17370 [Pseudomonadota bacterium]
MRIAIIVIIGIFAYLIVFIPGYFFIVPDRNSRGLSDNKTSVQLQADSTARKIIRTAHSKSWRCSTPKVTPHFLELYFSVLPMNVGTVFNCIIPHQSFAIRSNYVDPSDIQ